MVNSAKYYSNPAIATTTTVLMSLKSRDCMAIWHGSEVLLVLPCLYPMTDMR
jgi:hypothetical protein